MRSPVEITRHQTLERMFPAGVPKLWCPPITHYLPDGQLDCARIAAHLAHLRPYVGGLLAAGSTGDGWELDPARYRLGVRQCLAAAAEHGFQVLIGALRPSTDEVRERIVEWLQEFAAGTAGAARLARLAGQRVTAFTICGPVGADLAPAFIEAELVRLLEMEIPLSLYQLPQVTGYTIATEVLNRLAARFPNFLIFKDTSGTDAVATSLHPLPGVFLVRGAEGDYLRWLRLGGGPYDGLLLSSANCFARQLHEVIEAARTGEIGLAKQRSDQVASAMKDLFAVVQHVSTGNAFANANKVGDHFMAWGPDGHEAAPPRFSNGQALPLDVIRAGGEVLSRHDLLPTRGYLED